VFKIKICGVTNAHDAAMAVNAGADGVGINFYPPSPRFVAVDGPHAELFGLQLAGNGVKVGVFVNASVHEMTDTAARAALDCIQLHGDEPADLLAQLPSHLSIIKAYRCGPNGLAPLAEYLDACRQHGRVPNAVLIDAETNAANEYGGTGRVAHWKQISRDRERLGAVPLVLAGGLTPDNVADAIAAVRPDGVDVASGVESAPGQKDPRLVERFVAAARDAFIRYD
jgi:phosphoribosylanthranilate isomerase